MIYFYIFLLFLGGYLLGNVNFARIFSWRLARKDITTVGSKNPGTMNVLRTRGLSEALLTLAFEAIKSGVPAIVFFYVFKTYFPGFENLAYFSTAFGAVVGHCFPIVYKFKGGKGVACTFGMFVFHPFFWWVSLVMFVICFFLFFYIPFPFIISLTFILTMTVCATCIFSLGGGVTTAVVLVLVLLWLNFALILFMHRGNIKRLCTGTENKVNFREKVFKKKEKKTYESQAQATEFDDSENQ